MQRIIEPVEIARAIAHLPAGATYTTGLTLAADGDQSVA